MGYIVDELFAFIATDEDGDEGVIAAEMGDMMMPLVAADLTRVNDLAKIANAIKQQTGVDYKLKHFKLLGDVSDEYLEQFTVPESEPEGAVPDVQGEVHPDKRESDSGGDSDGGGEDVA